MKYLIKTLSAIVITTPLLLSCGGDDGFTTGTGTGTSSSTNVISGKHFSIGISPIDPAVIDDDGGHGGIEVEVAVRAGDRFDAAVTSGTIYFRTEYGLLQENSCQLGENGTCSVTWISELIGFPNDLLNTFTAYTLGEEGFIDLDGSGNFTDGDSFNDGNSNTIDMTEPFLDISRGGGAFVAGVDIPIDLDGNGSHTFADGLYSGAGCTHGSLCGATTLIYIFDQFTMNLDQRTPPADP
jgi:hypothetical protein